MDQDGGPVIASYGVIITYIDLQLVRDQGVTEWSYLRNKHWSPTVANPQGVVGPCHVVGISRDFLSNEMDSQRESSNDQFDVS